MVRTSAYLLGGRDSTQNDTLLSVRSLHQLLELLRYLLHALHPKTSANTLPSGYSSAGYSDHYSTALSQRHCSIS